MILLIHIVIALSSLVYTGFTFIAPSKIKLSGSYGLVALTLASGTYLVISTHAPLASACLSGVAYLSIALAGLIPAHLKFARANN